MVEDMVVLTSRFLTGFGTQLLCTKIRPIVGVHSVGGAIAKPSLPMAFLGQIQERDSQFP